MHCVLGTLSIASKMRRGVGGGGRLSVPEEAYSLEGKAGK